LFVLRGFYALVLFSSSILLREYFRDISHYGWNSWDIPGTILYKPCQNRDVFVAINTTNFCVNSVKKPTKRIGLPAWVHVEQAPTPSDPLTKPGAKAEQLEESLLVHFFHFL
jgi:hypothetical protein